MGSNIASSMQAWGSGFLSYLIPFLFVLTVVVFFHELGHFLIARLCRIRVLVFSLGFGPELAGRNDRHGTRWKISAVPLGGYVKFLGDDNAASVTDAEAVAAMPEDERRQTFLAQPVWARAAVVVAGPLANFLLAIIIFAGIFMFHGKQITAARIDTVQPGSAAAAAGLKPGDLITAVEGQPVASFNDLQRIVGINAGQILKVTVDRDGQLLTFTAEPKLTEIKDNFGNTHRIGVLGITRSIKPDDAAIEKFGPLPALWLGVKETWFVTSRTLAYIGGVFTGREAADQLGGPIRIAQVSGQVASAGFVALLNLAAILSISIGLLNLFPVPLLDGGHLLFYGIEAVRGKPLSERAQEVGFRIGFAIVVMLMIFATFNDILHLASS